MRQMLLIAGAIVLMLPEMFLRLVSTPIDPLAGSLVYGMAVIGAAFLLSWAAEVAQRDIPRSLALTILALIAVLPEYAVDMYLTWRAAGNPQTYGPLALVTMTGANRLLIGIGWPTVVLVYWLRARRIGKRVTGVTIDPDQTVDVAFLGLATLYSFVIPLKGTLSIVDMVVLVAIFGLYA
jgi:cation:H+ antiporter